MCPDSAKARALVAASRGRAALSEHDAKDVLACFGIAVPRRVLVSFGEPAAAAIAGLSPPFALKVASADILHKSDLGGVRLGLRCATEVQEAIAAMTTLLADHPIEGWLIEEMAPAGPEIVIGGTVDPCFGPNVMVGLGGVLVELFEDVCFGICPLRASDARRMLDSLRGVKLLRGFRAAPPANEDAVIETLMRVGGPDGLMPTLAGMVTELDINPLIVSAQGAVAVDARIVLRGQGG